MVLEENVRSGGLGEQVEDFVLEEGLKLHVLSIALPDTYIEHGSVQEQKEKTGLTTDQILKRILDFTGKDA